MQVVDRLKNDGLRSKAEFLLKRLSDVRKADEIRRVNDPSQFRPMIVDE